MLKIIFTIFLISPLFLFSVSDKTQNISKKISTPSPTKTPVNEKENGVEELILDENTVYLICPGDEYSCTEDNLNIKIKSLSKNAEKDKLNYYYTVSGGQIIGEGANVVWNLSGVRPGKYSITASVGKDNIIYGKTITKTVEVEECPVCDMFCECPTIEVSGPTKPIKAGDSFIVKANVSGGSQDSIEYNWKVTGGTIISDKNSTQVVVKTDSGKKNNSVTVTVELKGLCDPCPNEDSETFIIK